MKKLIALIMVFLFTFLFYACNLNTAVVPAEEPDTYYVLGHSGIIWKCKKEGIKMICKGLVSD